MGTKATNATSPTPPISKYLAVLTLLFLMTSSVEARWLDPERGRWISEEPVGLDGPNLYHFNFNNPVNRIDEDGLNSIPIPATGVLTPGGLFGGAPIPTNPVSGTLMSPFHQFTWGSWRSATAFKHPGFPGGLQPTGTVPWMQVGGACAAGAGIGYFGLVMPSQTAQLNSQTELLNQSFADQDWTVCKSRCLEVSSTGLDFGRCMNDCMENFGHDPVLPHL